MPLARCTDLLLCALRALPAPTLLAALLLAFAPAPSHCQQSPGWPQRAWSASDKIQASPLIVDLDNDGFQEIVVPSFDNKLHAYRHDGSRVPGWPAMLSTGGDGAISSAAAGDVDGDGQLEIVVALDDKASKEAAVHVYNANGTLFAQRLLNSNDNASAKATCCLVNCKKYLGETPHPRLEIVVRDGDGLVHILSNDSGSLLTEVWDTDSTLATCTDTSQKDRLASQRITPSVSAVELPNGKTYLVAASTDGKVYRWEVTSTSSNNLSISKLTTLSCPGGETPEFLGSAALSDLDNDGDYEIVAGALNGKVYVWEGSGDGTQFSAQWPRSTGQGIVSSPCVAQADPTTTNKMIFIGSDDCHLHAWYADGAPAPGWPQAVGGQIYASPVAAQTDATPGLEVFVGALDGRLYGWTHAGQSLAGWPKRLATPLFSSPAVADLHTGKHASVVVAGYDGRIFSFDLAAKVPQQAGWLQFRGGPKRTGTD